MDLCNAWISCSKRFLELIIMFIKPYVAYPLLLIASVIGFSIGGNVKTEKTINETLKLCNQKPNECRFKYDILMYNETGKVPYPLVKPQPETKPQDKK